MAATAQNTNNTTTRSILLAEKLTGSNFTNWYRNLRIVLKYEKKMKFMEQRVRPAPDPETANPDTIDKYYEIVNLEQEVACLMLSSMSPDLQRTLEKYNAFDMVKELKTMFEEQAKKELFEIVKALHACKQEEGQSVSSYLLKMKSYLDTLERLGYAMPYELVMIAELHAMLKLHEKGILKKAETPVVLAIREGKIQKDKKKLRGAKGADKGKNKLAYAPKPKTSSPPKRDNPAKDSICHHYKEVGHWRRNCLSYQAEFKKRKEGLRRSKKLKHRGLSLKHRRMRTAVEAIGSFDLILPSGLIIVLDNYDAQAFSTSNGKELRISERIPQAPDRYGFYVDVEEYELWDLNEPPNYKAALPHPEFDKWSKWIFKIKTGMDGNVHTFKACLVEKGYAQTYAVDYGETFSPVADIRAIKILLAIAAFYDYEIWQMDVKISFLNSHLSEDVYMVQPEGFVDPKHPNKDANFDVPFMD
ncbi:zinc finger, CCHC-type containing protein [Tanacetum coccineum]